MLHQMYNLILHYDVHIKRTFIVHVTYIRSTFDVHSNLHYKAHAHYLLMHFVCTLALCMHMGNVHFDVH